MKPSAVPLVGMAKSSLPGIEALMFWFEFRTNSLGSLAKKLQASANTRGKATDEREIRSSSGLQNHPLGSFILPGFRAQLHGELTV